MREIDLKKYDIHTDLVVDLIETDSKFETKYKYKNVIVSEVYLNKRNSEILNKPKGDYITIYFNDITDHNNYNNVLKVFKEELSKLIDKTKIKDKDSVMIIGLGNSKSTADSVGVSSAEKVIVTNHIYNLTGSLEKGYRKTTCLIPGVMATTGVETSDIIKGVVEKTKPNFLIVIDSLASSNLNRLLKTIQITNTGINPGSGIGNRRKEISKNVLGIPVIAIGIPTVVSALTIVKEVFNDIEKQIDSSLNDLIVTPKEIDFINQKLSDLISSGINNSIHNISTKK